MQPAKSPPPRMVDPMEKNASTELESGVLERRSRTPPCTINTARVSSEPMPNHHTNVRIFPHVESDRSLPNLSTSPKRTITVSTYSLECQEKDLRQSTTDYPSVALPKAFREFSPWWRKIDTLCFALLTMANPGCSSRPLASFREVIAKGAYGVG